MVPASSLQAKCAAHTRLGLRVRLLVDERLGVRERVRVRVRVLDRVRVGDADRDFERVAVDVPVCDVVVTGGVYAHASPVVAAAPGNVPTWMK